MFSCLGQHEPSGTVGWMYLLNSGDGGIMYTVMYGDDERIKKNNCKNRAIKVLWYVSTD